MDGVYCPIGHYSNVGRVSLRFPKTTGYFHTGNGIERVFCSRETNLKFRIVRGILIVNVPLSVSCKHQYNSSLRVPHEIQLLKSRGDSSIHQSPAQALPTKGVINTHLDRSSMQLPYPPSHKQTRWTCKALQDLCKIEIHD